MNPRASLQQARNNMTTTTTIFGNQFKRFLRSVRIPPVYIFLIVIFLGGGLLDQLFSDGQIFTNQAIAINIIVRSVALGIVAVGQTLVIVGASIDLSVAYVISITAVMSSYIMQGEPANVHKAILVVFAIGALIGLVNGLIITKLHVNAFITTLGTSLIIKGIINATFSNYTGSVPKSFQYFGYGTIGPIPVAVIVLLVIVIAGLRTDRVLIGAHILCSMTAVLTGLFLVSRLQSGAPWVGPDGLYDLESIATTVVGGTALAGGKGGVWGTLAGVLIFGVLDTVFNQLGVNPYLKTVLRGAIIVLAVASYTYRSKKEAA
jgi:ribose transport system permease protein